jgi:hypothetical protein
MQTPAPTSLLRLLVSNELNTPGDLCAAFGSMLHWVGLRAVAFGYACGCVLHGVTFSCLHLVACGCMVVAVVAVAVVAIMVMAVREVVTVVVRVVRGGDGGGKLG